MVTGRPLKLVIYIVEIETSHMPMYYDLYISHE
jgi:hypothetical protein